MPETASGLINATDLSELVSRYMNNDDVSRVYDAYLLAAEAHDGVVRKSGELYIFHPLEVAYTLADLHMDADTICAALLHDVIEDTEFTKADLSERFGEVVAGLVDGVTKLTGGEFTSRDEANAANFQKMMIAMTQDFRVVLIKLADRLHNVKTLGVRKPEAKRRIAQETLDIHVPLARRMGMNAMRKDLQVNAFKHLFPWRAKVLQKALDRFICENTNTHQEIIKNITAALYESKVKGRVFLWDKNIYRLYQRIRNSKNHLGAQLEGIELRILVNSNTECYAALGVIHQLYQPKIGKFKDFIATPKGYGFQALQTALLTPQRQLIIVQIQSHEMFQVAQYGITAHCRNPNLLNSSDKSQIYLNRWLRQVEEIQQVTGNAAEFLQDMKADLFLSEIYVSTPKGETKVLPKGSTPIDFAYAIHTEVGNKCVSAYIDGELCRLNAQIPNGATVKIITNEDATPHTIWLNYVITGKARSSIRSWINKQKSHEFVALGKKILEKSLKKFGASLDEIDSINMLNTIEVLGLNDEDALFSSIAKGNQSSILVAKRLLDNDSLMPIEDEEQILLIKGTEGLAVHLQNCCHPVPNDAIVAQLDESQGLEVHRTNCPTLSHSKELQKKETMSIAWVDDTTGESHFLAPLNVQVQNRVGVLSHITGFLEKMRVNIEDVNIAGDSNVKDMYFLLQVKNAVHLRQIAESLKHQSHVISVARLFNKVK